MQPRNLLSLKFLLPLQISTNPTLIENDRLLSAESQNLIKTRIIIKAMVKLVTARDFRLYGPRPARNRSEYINAGLYVFATVVLLCGFVAQLSREPKSGLVLILIASALIMIVNLHDLFAHLAGIDYRLRLLVQYDAQLVFVEFAVPLVQAIGYLLLFLGTLFLLIQEQRGHGYYKLEKHAMDMLIAAPVLWLLGSIHNSCQIYERADGHVQILQQSVHVPFLIGSLLFLVATILNSYEQVGLAHHGIDLLGRNWVWFCIFGSSFLLLGGLANVLKVFKMQQTGGLRLEKLRGGAYDRLLGEREGTIPLILEEQRRRVRHIEDDKSREVAPTPYKDVLIGGQSS